MGHSPKTVKAWLAAASGTTTAPTKKPRKPPDRTKAIAWLDAMKAAPGYFLPLQTFSEANQRHRWDIIKRAKAHRTFTKLYFRARFNQEGTPRLPAVVTITRYTPNRLLDEDNLARALKAVQDGIADSFGVDDGDRTRYTWKREQAKAPHYGIGISITPTKEEAC